MPAKSEELRGIIYAICAFTFWGLVPIYFKLLSHIDAFEVLIHRILWSVVFLSILIIFTKQFQTLKNILKDRKKLIILFISAFLVSFNWLVFIWAIANNMIMEASLGYYINPLVNVFLGMVFFGEKAKKLQIIAIVLACVAIVYQIISLNSIPVVSLILAFSFGLYGLARKKINVPSVTGLLIETTLISPFALLYISYLFIYNKSNFLFPPDQTSLLLACAGFITVIPLLWFNGAAIRISMFKLGFLQYLGPSIAFLLAVFVYDEPFNKEKIITFIIIWLALIIFTISDIKKIKK